MNSLYFLHFSKRMKEFLKLFVTIIYIDTLLACEAVTFAELSVDETVSICLDYLLQEKNAHLFYLFLYWNFFSGITDVLQIDRTQRVQLRQ